MARSNSVIEVKINQDKLNHQTQIANTARDVGRQESIIENLMLKVEAEIEKLPEWEEYENAKAAVEVTREALNMAASRAKGVNDLKEEVAAAKAELRHIRQELSGLLVGYITAYQERSLTVNYEHRAIDVKAKLGKTITDQEMLSL